MKAADTRRAAGPSRPAAARRPESTARPSRAAAVRSLQRALGNRGIGALLGPAAVGRPLTREARKAAEERFGGDFDTVRVYEGAEASAAAERLGARAFTLGADIAFGAGELAPGTQRGDRLLDHELAHVAQQQRGGEHPPSLEPGAPEERAADRPAAEEGGAAEVGGTAVGLATQSRGQALSLAELQSLLDWLEDRPQTGQAAQGQATPEGQELGDPVAQIRAGIRADAERRVAEQGGVRDRLSLWFGDIVGYPSGAEPPPGIRNLPRRTRKVPTVEFMATNAEKGGGQAAVTNVTTITQTQPDPSAGYNFDTYLLNHTTGRLIPAQHVGGTRYRVLMGTPECPGCHFGQGLVVDLQGQHFGLVTTPMLMSAAGALRRPPPMNQAPGGTPPPTIRSERQLAPTVQQGGGTPVFVQGRGETVTTAEGLSAAAGRGRAVVVQPAAGPAPAPATATPQVESGAGVLQRPVIPSRDVTLGVQVGWTSDPAEIVRRVQGAGYTPVTPPPLPQPDIAPGFDVMRLLAALGGRGRETVLELPPAPGGGPIVDPEKRPAVTDPTDPTRSSTVDLPGAVPAEKTPIGDVPATGESLELAKKRSWHTVTPADRALIQQWIAQERAKLGQATDWSDVAEELEQVPEAPPLPQQQNIYPVFDKVTPKLRRDAAAEAEKLTGFTGLQIPRDRVLDSPWTGRIYNLTKTRTRSSGTSLGWERNESQFWKAFEKTFPKDYSLLTPDHRITAAFAQRWGWPPELVGDKLVHHHMSNSRFVVPLPETYHRELSELIHSPFSILGE